MPFPKYPLLQEQVKLPTMLRHCAFELQLSMFRSHSFKSEQKTLIKILFQNYQKHMTFRKKSAAVNQNILTFLQLL